MRFFFPFRFYIFVFPEFSFLIAIPKFFYKKINEKAVSLLFTKEAFFNFFIKKLVLISKSFFSIFLLKVRIRGLGYRMRTVSSSLIQLFFVHRNFIYFYVPPRILVNARKKKMVFISTDRWLIHSLFTHIVLLKKSAIYQRMGFLYPRELHILKPIKKIN